MWPYIIYLVVGFIGGIALTYWWDKSIIKNKKAEIESLELVNQQLDSDLGHQKKEVEKITESLTGTQEKIVQLKAKAEEVKAEKSNTNIDDLLDHYSSQG